jgi:hypothetical protein
MTTDWTQNHRGLKRLVAVLTLLLAVGLGLLVYGLARTAGKLGGGGTAAAGFPDARLALPPGSRVVETVAADGRLYLRTEDGAGGGVLFVLDAGDGRLIGRVLLESGSREAGR